MTERHTANHGTEAIASRQLTSQRNVLLDCPVCSSPVRYYDDGCAQQAVVRLDGLDLVYEVKSTHVAVLTPPWQATLGAVDDAGQWHVCLRGHRREARHKRLCRNSQLLLLSHMNKPDSVRLLFVLHCFRASLQGDSEF